MIQLRNLNRIEFRTSTLDHVRLFLRTNPKLQQMKVYSFLDVNYAWQDKLVLDLCKLNKERCQLTNGMKTTLYVSESVATKWAKRDTNLGLIQLKRVESCELINEFDFVGDENYSGEKTRDSLNNIRNHHV